MGWGGRFLVGALVALSASSAAALSNPNSFCVGDPWHEQLVNQGIGYTACTTG